MIQVFYGFSVKWLQGYVVNDFKIYGLWLSVFAWAGLILDCMFFFPLGLMRLIKK